MDPDGDGFTNLQEYLVGTDSAIGTTSFRITNFAPEGNIIRVTWMMGNGKTNALQVSIGDDGYDTNAFADIFIVTDVLGGLTNYLDLGAATNSPSWFYRMRLVP